MAGRGRGRGRGRGSRQVSTESTPGLEGKVKATAAISFEKKNEVVHTSNSRKQAASRPQESPTRLGTQQNGSNARKPSTPRQNSSDMKQEHLKEKKGIASPQASTVVPKRMPNNGTTKMPDNSTVDGAEKPNDIQSNKKEYVRKGSEPQEDSQRSIVRPGPDEAHRLYSETSKRLRFVVQNLRLKMDDISIAASKVNDIVNQILRSEDITKHPLFAKIEAMNTGSYYERLKILHPNEFDIMLKVPVERITLTPFEKTGKTEKSGAYYTLALKRMSKDDPWRLYIHQESRQILQSLVLSDLRKIVKAALKRTGYNITIQRKSPKSPAITFEIESKPENISVDLVLALEVNQSWPEAVKDGMKIEEWLGTKTRKDLRYEPFYFVAKKPGDISETQDVDDVWRLSFSNIEKEIVTNHGHAKTCCESEGKKCCRKPCLKLLKCLLELIKIFSRKRCLGVFCSYHVKTAFFHCCVDKFLDQDWKKEDLGSCFDRLVESFLKHLENAQLPNFFIPSHNLFDEFPENCFQVLQSEIRKEKSLNYPIFDHITVR
uniref:Cyclic GMP-AMP synthase n=1 Tax=Leptobrachium leishanense TaxID=445787 RepID=A0A8C5WLJ6_9ANUR